LTLNIIIGHILIDIDSGGLVILFVLIQVTEVCQNLFVVRGKEYKFDYHVEDVNNHSWNPESCSKVSVQVCSSLKPVEAENVRVHYHRDPAARNGHFDNNLKDVNYEDNNDPIDVPRLTVWNECLSRIEEKWSDPGVK